MPPARLEAATSEEDWLGKKYFKLREQLHNLTRWSTLEVPLEFLLPKSCIFGWFHRVIWIHYGLRSLIDSQQKDDFENSWSIFVWKRNYQPPASHKRKGTEMSENPKKAKAAQEPAKVLQVQTEPATWLCVCCVDAMVGEVASACAQNSKTLYHTLSRWFPR